MLCGIYDIHFVQRSCRQDTMLSLGDWLVNELFIAGALVSIRSIDEAKYAMDPDTLKRMILMSLSSWSLLS